MLDKKLCAFGLEINEILVELAVLPVFGIVRFEKYAFDAIPLSDVQGLRVPIDATPGISKTVGFPINCSNGISLSRLPLSTK